MKKAIKYLNNNKFFIITIIILSILMFYYIGRKQGYHEDEIFSYGSSNYKYDNVYRSYGDMEWTNEIVYNKILKGNIFSNTYNYIKDNTYFSKDSNLIKEIPTWKSKDKALEYLAIQDYDIFNYFSVYYNQARDVHPPLFYFLVHFVSCLYYNTFSKYIIFTINLFFFIASLFIISKIMDKLNIKNLRIPTIILYGASMGGISTVMFQRMYMMLTFFSLLYLYHIINYIKNDFKIEKKIPLILTILGGFLTQYYFCIYIVLVFLIISIYLAIKKRYKDIWNLFKIHLISAIIGIILYPASIYHIFFSYRGIGSSANRSILENLIYYIKQIGVAFSINYIYLLILISIIAIAIIYKIILKKENNNSILYLIIIGLPIILYILIVSKISPYLGENYTSRYIMLLLPIIAIFIIYSISLLFKNKKALVNSMLIISVLLSIYGITNYKPVYLYEDNKKVIELAKTYQEDNFVYVFDNYFTHLSSMEEFAIYNKSLILNINKDDFSLLDSEELNNKNEYILCIKHWLNQEEILDKVLSSSGYSNYEELLNLSSDVESVYYKITK